MPLFDAIESDVTDFFVSQGSVFDILIKSVLERVSTVETRVQVLRTDVTNNLQSIRQQLLSNSTSSVDYVGTTLRTEQSLTAEAVAETAGRTAEAALKGAIARMDEQRRVEERIAGDRALKLAQQLNAVLELVFCPHTADVAMTEIQERQKQFTTIVALLDENERILKHLNDVAAVDNSKLTQTNDLIANGSTVTEPVLNSARPSQPQTVIDNTPELTPIPAEIQEQHTVITTPADVVQEDEECTQPSDVSPSIEVIANITSIDEHLENSDIADTTESIVVGDSTNPNSLPIAPLPTMRRKDTNMKRKRSTNPAVDRSRKKSVYHAYQDLQEVEEARLRELQQRDEDLLERMREMLEQAMSAVPPNNASTIDLELQQQQLEKLLALVADNDRTQFEREELINELKDKFNREQLMLSEALALHKEKLDELRLQLEKDLENLRRHFDDEFKTRDEKAESESGSNLKAIEQQLQDATTQLVAMLESQGQDFSAKMADFRDWAHNEFIGQSVLGDYEARWQRTATSNCVFGASPLTLLEFQQELQSIQKMGSSAEPQDSVDHDSDIDVGITSLTEAVYRVLAVSSSTCSNEYGPPNDSHFFAVTPDTLQAMKALRVQMAKVNDLIERTDSSNEQVPRLEIVAAALRRMELGTASLLDGCDAQFTRYHEALRSHQLVIGQLQQQLQLHKQDETALKVRLALCPSQEDTNRLLLDLQDKLTEMSIDSAARTAATLAELRAKMSDLPDNELLERLSMDLHTKADRSDIDRLRRLLEAQAIGNSEALAPTPSLTKSPLRCLSCDQSVFTPIPSRPGSPGSPIRHKCRDCGGKFAGFSPYDSVEAPRTISKAANHSEQDREEDTADDLFAIAAAARRRRQSEQLQTTDRLSVPSSSLSKRAETAGTRRAFLNLDDSRNRIPLRRTVLADHIVYGPSIAQHSARRKSDDSNGARGVHMENSIERRVPGGQVIARATTTSALVRPFAELEHSADQSVRTPSRQQLRDRSARGPR